MQSEKNKDGALGEGRGNLTRRVPVGEAGTVLRHP